MQTVALLARKGGTGKTTLAVHLAVLAASTGRRVLLVDTDPQRSAGDWWRVRKTDDPQLVECAVKRVPAVLDAARADGIDLVVVDTRPSVEACLLYTSTHTSSARRARSIASRRL